MPILSWVEPDFSPRSAHHQQAPGGFVLTTALLVLAFLTLTATLLLAMSLNEVTTDFAEWNRTAAFHAGEAAVELAIDALKNNGTVGTVANVRNQIFGLGGVIKASITAANVSASLRALNPQFADVNSLSGTTTILTDTPKAGEATVTSSATYKGFSRTVSRAVALQWGQPGAIVVDSTPGATPLTSPKSQGQRGDLTIRGNSANASQNHVTIDGGVRLNSNAYFYTGNSGQNGQTLQSALTSNPGGPPVQFTGGADALHTGLTGANAVPDYTNPGSADQLFDFNQFTAAASAKGTSYSLGDFVNLVNTSQGPLEGIIVVNVNATAFGGAQPKLKASGANPNKPEEFSLPNGVDIRGTLLFNITGTTDPLYKIFMETDLKINPADLSGVNFSDPATYTSGYPPTFSNPDRTPQAYGFPAGADLPALMYNTGILDIHRGANISGVLYTPSFVEIEQKTGNTTQYIRGQIISGGGVYLEDMSTAGPMVFSYDPNTIDTLAIGAGKGKILRTQWREGN